MKEVFSHTFAANVKKEKRKKKIQKYTAVLIHQMAPLLKRRASFLLFLSQNALDLDFSIKTAMIMINIHDDLQSLSKSVVIFTWFLLLHCSRIKFVGSLRTYLGSSYLAPAFGNKPETLNTKFCDSKQCKLVWIFYSPLSS